MYYLSCIEYFRNVQLESDDLSKVAIKVKALQTDVINFETSSKLNLKAAKTLTKNLVDATDAGAKASKVSLDKILEVINLVSSKQFRKDSKISKREEVANFLRASANR